MSSDPNLHPAAIGSGLDFIHVASGQINSFGLSSGAVVNNYRRGRCTKCGCYFGPSIGDEVWVQGVSGFVESWCWGCAGYRYQKGGFTTPEDVLRSMVPGGHDAPAYQLADYFEDKGLYLMAEHMRGLCSGG